MRIASIRLFVTAMAWMITCSAFTPKKPAPMAVQPAGLLTFYYWFSYPDDTYNTYCSTADECTALSNGLGVPVNTSGPGTIVERGFMSGITPHNAPPAILLYAHY